MDDANRRLAGILAADVVGYSAMIGKDEPGTLARVRALRTDLIEPLATEHGGRVFKTTGDGFLAEFASAVQALRCAVAVQERLNSEPDGLRLRIGVHQGEVVADGDDLLGDGVIIAARLEPLADPGGICISARVHEDAAGKMALEVDDLGTPELKNIAAKVQVFRVRLSPAERPAALPLPDKPSIAVLAFTNMSGDPEQEYFADGIAEDIITALSRYPSLFVIARNSCFTYKGRAAEVRQVGRELGVRYVLEGSLRKAANRIRVTAQLVETETGKHVWAERYDRDLADIFAVQDEISEAVTIAIAPAIAEAERQRAMRKPPDNLDAWAAYQRGLWHLGNATANDYKLAENFFRQALDLDRNFPDSYCALATANLRSADYQGRGLPEALSSAEVLARRAVALDGADAEGRSRLANALYRQGDYEGGLAEAELALSISPNLADAHGERGAALIFSGRPKEGVTVSERCIRLDPGRSALRLNQIA